MSPNKLRIAVSGFPGTGKTTLAHALGERLEIPVIQEEMSAIAISQRNFAFADGRRDIAEKDALRKRMFDSFVEWERSRTKKYINNKAFVADRWQADLLELWLLRCSQSRFAEDSITSHLLKRFQESAKIFDLVIVTPMIKPFALQDNEQEISRNISLTAHVLSMALIMGLMQNFADVPLYNLPNEDLSVQERVEMILKVLRARQLV